MRSRPPSEDELLRQRARLVRAERASCLGVRDNMNPSREQTEKAAIAYLQYVCDKTGGVPTEFRMVPRSELTRELLGMDDREVVGYLAGKHFIGYDTGRVWLSEAGVHHLSLLGLCREPKGMAGRPNCGELIERAAAFLEALYDGVGGVDGEIGQIALRAGIEHEDDVYYVAIVYLRDSMGFIAQGRSLSSVRITSSGVAFVERARRLT